VWPTDFVGHWSESRFLVILSGCGEDALPSVCDRIFKMVASASIHWWGEELSVGVSMGRAGAVAGDTAESILQRAQPAPGGNPGGNQGAPPAGAAVTAAAKGRPGVD
jgi:GGDEF domain-containing protein